MKKIIYILLLLLFIGCSNLKAQSNSTNKNKERPQANSLNEDQEQFYYYNDPEPEILLERENILKLLKQKEDNELNINNFFEIKKLEKNEQKVDISNCTKVTERFFVNGIENKLNTGTVDYYDKNGNHVLQIRDNKNGRIQNIYKHNEKNEMIGYSYLDNSSGIIEKIIENDRIIFLKKETSYNDEFKLIEKKVFKINDNLLSGIKFYEDGFSYWIYNDKNDVIFYGYNNEKTDGTREEKYSIEYDSRFNKKRIKAYENGNFIYKTINSYTKNNLLQQSIKIFHLGNKSQKTLYTYDNRNNLLEEKILDNNDEEIVAKYYQYDNENRIIKKREKRQNYERYWLYEYSKVEDEENYLYYLHDNIIKVIRINPIIFDIVDNSLDELLGLLKLNNNHIINTRTSNNRHNPDINNYYDIEGGPYKLSVLHNEYIGYYLLSIEIDIDKNNYLNLFPYKTINDYLSENNFDEVHKVNEKRIMYYGRGDFDSCFLNFSNNILTSIEIYNILEDIESLFKINIKPFNLCSNLIRGIDFDMDYGAANYIYMTGCPVGEKYFKWEEP
jgi:hypothetical protein